MVFGGLGVMLYGGHSPLSSFERIMRKVDVQSVFFATIFVIILLVLAYLTNPSETSFRTYLTEQSFRQHLSRLEDNNHEDPCDSDDSGVHFSLVRKRSKIAQSDLPSFNSAHSLHFANRAAVSLRTPKHVFYSFGVMTIAAVLPSTGSSGAQNQAQGGFMVSESWFIGAFGRWWRGGPIQAWWADTVGNAKDTERCNSGVLDMKALDALNRYDSLSVHPPMLAGHLSMNGCESPSKLRPTERSLHRTTSGTSRSTTPPPLPKSASLPLHVARISHDKLQSQRSTISPTQAPPALVPEHARLNAPQLSPSPSTIFDQSPVIIEILRQISNSKASVHDLRTQLKDFHAAAAESHTFIQNELDTHRERKRNEDLARVELKTRTKTLEDSKRVAETSKREAEKRLRAAETARDSATERIGRLDREIGALEVRMSEDEVAIVKCQEDGDEMEKELVEQLERKRKEIKVAEEVVAALNSRTKELEERITIEEERVNRAKDRAELKKQDRAFYPLHVVNEPLVSSLWSPIVPDTSAQASLDPHADIHTEYSAQIEVFPEAAEVASSEAQEGATAPSDMSDDPTLSPRPRQLSLGTISNLREPRRPSVPDVSLPNVALRIVLPEDGPPSLSTARTQSTKFSPFSDQELDAPADLQGGLAISPRSTSLIPTSLMDTLGGEPVVEDLSRSFQSENDFILDRDWRKLNPPTVNAVESLPVFNTSPTSLNCPPFDAVENEDPFEVRLPPPPLRHRFTSDGLENERIYLSDPFIGPVGMQPLIRSRTQESDSSDRVIERQRRWFGSSREQGDRKAGLNPEAKVFHFKKSFPMFGTGQKPTSFDSVISYPSSTISSLSVPSLLAPPPSDTNSLFSTLSMRAFAPSPEEREALGRAMGPTNTSLERLPTLSDVVIGSLPSSPNHVHAIAAQHTPQHALVGAAPRSLLAPSFSWLPSLPRMKKAKFSPWEDETSEDFAVVNGAH